MPATPSSVPDLAKTEPRYPIMLETLGTVRTLVEGRNWYDFGCGYGWSSVALYELGASQVRSYEPNVERVARCPDVLDVSATDDLTSYDNVLAYGVLEHVYFDEREPILSNLWNRLARGGFMIIGDTPNRLLPYDPHTTQLPLIPWLPASVAEAMARICGRLPPDEWLSSGFRGLALGDFRSLTGKIDRSPITRRRHRILRRFGLHPQLIDPWPLWVWQKP